MAVEDTLPKLLLRNYKRYGDQKVAMRKMDFGIWNEYTWKDYYENVKYFSLGLLEMGLEPKGKMCIIGENDPEWFWGQLAIEAAGGVSIGIMVDSIPDEIKYIIDHSDSSFVLAKDQEQVDKVLGIKDELPKVKKIIYWDPKGLRSYRDPILASFNQVVELGKSYDETHPGFFEQMVERGKGDDIAIFCYTSGTRALPKGAMLTHRNLISGMGTTPHTFSLKEGYEVVSFVPPSWIAEEGLSIVLQLIAGLTVNFPEEPETVQENIRDIAPNNIFYGSRLWESLISQIQVKINDAGAVKRLVYSLFLPTGYKRADLYYANQEPSLFWKAIFGIAELAVFRPLKDKLGLGRVGFGGTGGAPLSPTAFRFLRGLGISIYNIYGLTEVTPLTIHRPGNVKFESVGPPSPGATVAISDEGEILGRAGSVFAGYYKMPEETQEILKDGWLHSGDGGFIDEDGHVIYYDRLVDLLKLADGTKFAPQYIEGRLKFSPYIKDSMVLGGKDKGYVTALIDIDFDIVGKWAEKNHIPYTTFTDLSQKPQVYDLVQKDVEQVNRTLPDPAKVSKYILFYKEFDPDEAELTRTRKLRRGYMEERYKNLIDAMYSDKTETGVEAEVRYRDGRVGKVKTPVAIRSLF